jgi:predicted Zn finger-like uncharacterized protein
MRLICPNCDAEYEVEDSAIPDTGRDVQCSNCGHAWFQLPPEIELALEQEEELFGQAAAADPSSASEAAVAEAPAQSRADEAMPNAMAADAASMVSDAATPSDPPRRTLDDNLMAILREEAEREAAARRSEGSVIETQPDLGLAAPASPPPSPPPAPVTGGLAGAARRIAQMQGKDPDAPPPAPPRAATRRDLLPDIEEINSSLKGNEIPAQLGEDGQAVAAASEARGFRSGFALALFIAVVLLAAYVAAPQIKAQIPAVASSMDAYVAAVDGLRLWLDGAMRAATDSLRGMLAAEGGSAGG